MKTALNGYITLDSKALSPEVVNHFLNPGKGEEFYWEVDLFDANGNAIGKLRTEGLYKSRGGNVTSKIVGLEGKGEALEVTGKNLKRRKKGVAKKATPKKAAAKKKTPAELVKEMLG